MDVMCHGWEAWNVRCAANGTDYGWPAQKRRVGSTPTPGTTVLRKLTILSAGWD